MSVALPLKGGCQCGGLRYEISAAPVTVAGCHCTNCQKIGGGAFAVNAMVAEPSFRFIAGEPKEIEWTSDAGNRRIGWFCGDCGSRIAHGHKPGTGIFSVRAGTLDDASWVRPAGHIWVKSAQPWIVFAEDDILSDKQPADFNALVQRFRSFGIFPQ
ncbi:GFA family protein [Hyphococcus luteus]|uniref:Aldehyde-activating protein n=1 Tax=Hyphococcus luteus TaxID=2058213 RepID=A0A2S7K9J9_9PROT|nr:GFA family protein [Marinicaulis flavus]PQA89151.1 aldehyde-activating protein [Marinicaulis flavus]